MTGRTRKDIEAQSGQPVVSRSNYLPPLVEGAVQDGDVASAKPAKRTVAATKKKPKGDKV